MITYPPLYDMCLRWRTSSTLEHFSCQVTLDRATAAQMRQEQATELLESAAPRSPTVIIASSIQQEDQGPAKTSSSSLDPRTPLVYVYRTLKVAVRSLRCRVGSVGAKFGWIGSSDDDLIVTGLILSMMVQMMLVCWIWMDARAVCIQNLFYWISARTLIYLFFASWSRTRCIAFNNSQTHWNENPCIGSQLSDIAHDSPKQYTSKRVCQSKDKALAHTGRIILDVAAMS